MKKGSMVLEYTVLIIVLGLALVLMHSYILRGFAGRWRSVGATFGYGFQFDPDPAKTTVSENNNASL